MKENRLPSQVKISPHPDTGWGEKSVALIAVAFNLAPGEDILRVHQVTVDVGQ